MEWRFAKASEVRGRTQALRAALLVCLSSAAAQVATAGPDAAASAPSASIVAGERLSDWLLRQPGDSYPAGTAWYSAVERPAQQALKEATLRELRRRRGSSPADRQLGAWIESLPVTGRVAVAIADARWLQAHPAEDPLLGAQDRVASGPRPSTVSVVASDGSICQVPHQVGSTSMSYLLACRGDAARMSDWAWLAQPDGRSSRVGLAAWNAAEQEQPAPGAWIWAPPRAERHSRAFSQALIRLLATQGPAADGVGSAAVAPLPLPLPSAPSRAAVISASDWGEIGLLQTPSARMAPAATTRFHLSRVQPYTRGTVMFQPFDWLEAGFRYTSIDNRDYGPGNPQSFKDKSIDLKLRLAEESAYWPQVALGLRDIGGTGLFSGEYLVANKRFGSLDWSLGMGWGYAGARGDVRNPLSVFGSRFDQRPRPTQETGGTANVKSYFRGPVALFGGLQWHTPWDPLTLKVEVDGNDYRNEPLANPQRQRSPVNVGFVWRYAPGVDFTAGLERGDRFVVGLTVSTALDQLQMPKSADPPLPRFSAKMPAVSAAAGRTVDDIQAQTGWRVGGIEQRGSEWWVDLADASGAYRQERLERTIAVLHRDASAEVQRFVIRLADRGIARQSHAVDRAAWVATRNQATPPSTAPPVQRLGPSADGAPALASGGEPAPRTSFSLSPHIAPIVGGQDGFVLYRVDLLGRGEWRLTDSTWVNGVLALRLLDNYDRFVSSSTENLPQVRTLQREFATASRLTLPNLQLTHVGQPARDHFYSVYAGLLESMYAGVGAEWLWRPAASPLAFGVDLNQVRQREFEQKFGLRDYSVATGHATLYWNTGWQGVQASLSGGRYLAGDHGATVDVSRRFDNGVTLGAYATKTNVSAAQFGEGSFDKGIYVTFPMDALLPRSTTATGALLWSPLVRDGGARLARSQRLIDLTSLRDRQVFELKAPGLPAERSGEPLFDIPAELQR